MNRSLGASEHLLWRLAQTRPVNAVLCASLTGPLRVQRLREALDFAQRRHALLAVRIRTDAQGRPRFASDGVAPIPLRSLARRDARHWRHEAEAELTRPFAPEEGPLLRVTLLHGDRAHELLLTFDHAIGDGLSGALLLRDLFRELAQPGAGETLPEPAACEELLPPDLLGQRPRAPVRVPKEAPPVTAAPPAAVRLLTRELPAEATARLVAASRQERTSVHGALCAAFLLALAAETGSRDEVRLQVMSPVNLREHLSPPGAEDFAPRFSRLLTRHQFWTASPLWEVARDVKHQLQLGTEGPAKFSHLLEVRDFLATGPDTPTLHAFVREVMGSELTVTNLGRWSHAEQYGALRLRRLHATVSGLAPLIVGVTTVGGRMSVCSRFLASAFPLTQARRIEQGAWERLQSALPLTSQSPAL
jgi:hypothetical protein